MTIYTVEANHGHPDYNVLEIFTDYDLAVKFFDEQNSSCHDLLTLSMWSGEGRMVAKEICSK